MNRRTIILLLVFAVLFLSSCAHDIESSNTVRIACLGDSLTSDETWPNDAYTMFLSDILSEYTGKDGLKYEVKNFGTNGSTITGFGNRKKYGCVFSLDRYKKSLKYKPNIVVIMLGSNDAVGWEYAKASYESLYKELMNSYRKVNKDVKFIVATSPPHNNADYGKANLEEYVVPLQRKIASESKNACLLDVFKEFNEGSEPLSIYLREDKMHLSKEGGQKLAEIAAMKILEIYPLT